jgi:hypothetical protein
MNKPPPIPLLVKEGALIQRSFLKRREHQHTPPRNKGLLIQHSSLKRGEHQHAPSLQRRGIGGGKKILCLR